MFMMEAFQHRGCPGSICLTQKHLNRNLKRVKDIQGKRVRGGGSQGIAYWARSGSRWRVKIKGVRGRR